MSKDIIPNSLIGEGAEFKGNFKVAGSFRIDGYFEGKLTVNDHLFISPIGKLKTDTVYTKTIAIAGIFMGNVDASEEVQLLSSGRVLGNIKAPKLIMEPGVVVQGSIDITGSKSQQLNSIVESTFKSQNEQIIVKKIEKNEDEDKNIVSAEN
ncbi:MAG: polymer-forming cytoskeletal protein [Spirochaetota bacterium]|nr:polymer-forming cytoskeletal protein [Spirochaetota bacterium]